MDDLEILVAKRARQGGPQGGPPGVFAWAAAVLALTVARTVVAAPASAIKKDANVSVQAIADRTAVSPGEVMNLLISLKPEKDWHVYWRGPGGLSGLPTTVEWSGPLGFEFSRTLFPIPTRSIDAELNDTSYILEGEALLVTPVRVPTSAAAGKGAVFKATVSYLACKKECIPGNVEITLSVPIVAPGSKTEPANSELFGRAQRRFPLPPEKAKHVKLSDTTDKPRVKPGEKFTVSLVAELAAGHHMQSNKPSSNEHIPAILFLEPTDGLEIGEVIYPPARERTDKQLGKLSEYAGEVKLTIPVTVADDAGTAARWIRGVFQYQICNDAGTCFPPQHIEIAIPVQMEGGPAPSAAAVVAPPVAAAVTDDPEPEPLDVGAEPAGPSPNILTRAQSWLLGFGYKGALLVALIGGFVLNLMPCVLPVISLKILSFVRQAHDHRSRVFWLGMTYSAGILVFFAAIGVLFWQTNKQLGWGEQFQKPQVVIGLAAIVTAFALSLFEVFMIFPPKIINKLDEKAEGEGFLSAFATGLLATFLGTACTAPFLSAAIGAASKFSPAQGGFIFFAVGVGMALPFMILAANPGWLRFVPKAGAWMTTFEYLMGFLLLGTVIWLLNPLRSQIGGEGLLLALIFLLTVAMAAWIKGKIEFGAPIARKIKLNGLALVIVLAGWLLPFRYFTSVDKLIANQINSRELMADGLIYRQAGQNPLSLTQRRLDWTKGIPWQHYKRDRALEDVRKGYTVFIDYTADWCANCKVMLKTAIERPDVMAVMKELNVIPYTADYTLPVKEIKEDLERFKRGGVPVFVVYRPNDTDQPEILPEIITQGDLIEALRRAGPSRVQVAVKP
jgi:thiol:disulfide interchange protein